MHMWRAISQHVDFRKKHVVDLGCGHGEMLWRAWMAGAEYVCGIDKEMKPNALQLARTYPNIKFIERDLSGDTDGTGRVPYWMRDTTWDIAMCFSVLPYLDNYRRALKWLARSFPVVVLEVQYEPEPNNIGIANDSQMFTLLRESGFNIISQIGRTHVGIREAYRTIWKAEA